MLDRASASLDAARRTRAGARGGCRLRRAERPRDRLPCPSPREVARAGRGRSGGAARAAGRGRVHLHPHERARRGRRRPRSRALLAGDSAPRGSEGGQWFSFAAWFSHTTFSLLWTERYAQVRPLLDASIAQARATGDSGRLAVGLAHRGWLALRRGDLIAAEGDARTALAATELPAPPMYRVLNGGVLVEALVDQGELDAAEQALAPIESEAESGSLTAAVFASPAAGCASHKDESPKGSRTSWPSAWLLTRALVTCPSYLPWRSEAALAQLALGERESAGRLADEELELARAFGAPRALGVAKRAAGVVAGGDRGAFLLREAVDAFERGDAEPGESARTRRPRRPAPAAQSPHRSAGAAPRGARRRPPRGRQAARRIRRDRASRHRCAPAPGRAQRGSTR